MSKKARRRVRVVALQLCYAWDRKYEDDDGLLYCASEEDEPAPEAVVMQAGEALFEGYLRQRPAVDAVVDRSLRNWTLARLAAVDRCILRLGAYELLYEAEVPARAAINEAIELSKLYGSDPKTAKLVNGVLDRIAREHRESEMRR